MTFLAIVSPPSDCCFRYGFGAFATPCCLKNITCEEHDKLAEENKVNPIAGGSFGKHKVCPKDAEEAHRLASGLLFTAETKKIVFINNISYQNSYI